MTEKFEPTLKSIRKHEIPEWFHDAKLGIFIHWGLYSVPAYAPTGKGENLDILAKEGWTAYYAHNPYVSWYLNSLRISGSPTEQYHHQKYGPDFSYDDFVPIFNEEIKKWDPNEWGELFTKIGAKYVVLVTKHHDGFLPWPSKYPNPKKENYIASRDIVGELTKVVKERNIKMGLYYSGGLDWTYTLAPIRDAVDEFADTPNSKEYIELMSAHWRELIDRYQPSILWNDICFPRDANLAELIAYFYNKTPEGVVNDRWMQISKLFKKFALTKFGRRIICWYVKRLFLKKALAPPNPAHCDFSTPEYSSYSGIVEKKWEATRGIGSSFAYNETESPENHMTSDEMIRFFVDVVSKNGNLLLNLGPKADGTIPEIQKKCVLGLGKWLETNGQAIFGTRPWLRAEGITSDGIEIRFTQKADTLFIFLLDSPNKSPITIKSLILDKEAKIEWLGYDGKSNWIQNGEEVTIDIPETLEGSPVYTLSVIPKPSE